MNTFGSVVGAIAILLAPQAASALCIYNGKDNAKTTIAEEFRDSTWVVRAKVLSAKDHFSDVEDSWTSYRIEVEHAFKGHPAKRLRFFTLRDSGGFYLDRPGLLPAAHDIGGEYLLFLNPVGSQPLAPRASVGAVFVNYSCGRSGTWAKLSRPSRRVLATLEHRSSAPRFGASPYRVGTGASPR